MQADEDIKIELIQKGLRVVVPTDKKKDNSNVLQKAQEYVNGIKLMNEAIVEDIAHKNKVILKKNKQLIQKLTKTKPFRNSTESELICTFADYFNKNIKIIY